MTPDRIAQYQLIIKMSVNDFNDEVNLWLNRGYHFMEDRASVLIEEVGMRTRYRSEMVRYEVPIDLRVEPVFDHPNPIIRRPNRTTGVVANPETFDTIQAVDDMAEETPDRVRPERDPWDIRNMDAEVQMEDDEMTGDQLNRMGVHITMGGPAGRPETEDNVRTPNEALVRAARQVRTGDAVADINAGQTFGRILREQADTVAAEVPWEQTPMGQRNNIPDTLPITTIDPMGAMEANDPAPF
jgi:hypothetical protein